MFSFRIPTFIDLFPNSKRWEFFVFSSFLSGMTLLAGTQTLYDREINTPIKIIPFLFCAIIIGNVLMKDPEEIHSIMDFYAPDNLFISCYMISLTGCVAVVLICLEFEAVHSLAMGWNVVLIVTVISFMNLGYFQNPVPVVRKRFFRLRWMRSLEPYLTEKTQWIEGKGFIFDSKMSNHEILHQLALSKDVPTAINRSKNQTGSRPIGIFLSGKRIILCEYNNMHQINDPANRVILFARKQKKINSILFLKKI